MHEKSKKQRLTTSLYPVLSATINYLSQKCPNSLTSSTISDTAERPTAKSQRAVFSRTRRAARYCALKRYSQFHIWGVFPLSTQLNALHGATAKTINNNVKTATLTKLHIHKVATIKETCMHSNYY